MITHSKRFTIQYQGKELWVYYYPIEWAPYYKVHFPDMSVITISKSPTSNKWMGDKRAEGIGELIDQYLRIV